MVMGQLIFKARIDYSLWEKILDLATNDANDGYTGLLEYIEEPVNCHCECIEGTKWCEIELGADSFREIEWVAAHRIISCILNWASNYDITSIGYLEFVKCPIGYSGQLYAVVDPFTPNKEREQWLKDNAECLTSEQAIHYFSTIGPLKSDDNGEE